MTIDYKEIAEKRTPTPKPPPYRAGNPLPATRAVARVIEGLLRRWGYLTRNQIAYLLSASYADTVRVFMKYPHLARLQRELRRQVAEEAEETLRKAIADGNVRAAQFVAERLDREAYGASVDVNVDAEAVTAAEVVIIESVEEWRRLQQGNEGKEDGADGQ